MNKQNWTYGDRVKIIDNHPRATSYVGETGIFLNWRQEQMMVRLTSGRYIGKTYPFWLDEVERYHE